MQGNPESTGTGKKALFLKRPLSREVKNISVKAELPLIKKADPLYESACDLFTEAQPADRYGRLLPDRSADHLSRGLNCI